MSTLLDIVPAWVLALGGAAGIIVVWRYFGLRAALAAVGALVVSGAYKAGRKSGSADVRQSVDKANRDAVKQHQEIENETRQMSDDELDRANAGFVRKPSDKR